MTNTYSGVCLGCSSTLISKKWLTLQALLLTAYLKISVAHPEEQALKTTIETVYKRYARYSAVHLVCLRLLVDQLKHVVSCHVRSESCIQRSGVCPYPDPELYAV